MTKSPVEKNGVYEVEIYNIGYKGKGVGRINNFTVFVPGAVPGDTVKTRIIRVKKSYAFGKLIEILKPSETRINPRCSVFERCGGCQLQHIDYDQQLVLKKKLVEDNLERIGKLKGIKIHDCIGMEYPWRYRNKAQFRVSEIGGKPVTGFYELMSYDIVDTPFCLIQHQASDAVTEIMRKYIERFDIPVYNQRTGKGLIRHVVTRIGFSTGEVMVIVVINGEDMPHLKELVEDITAGVPNVETIVLNVNRKKTNMVLGDKVKVIYGKGYIEDFLGELKFRISPLSFFQVNPVQTEVLYEKAVEYAGLSGKETVFDLYCGIGTISLFMAKRADRVYGVEVVKAAVEDARINADLNNINNVEFLNGRAQDVINDLYNKNILADVVVLDPPRKGCHKALLEVLVEKRPERIVYVSCNPSTLARDLKKLSEGGYEIKEIQPVDMFPHTAHVECVAALTRRNTEF